LDAAIARFINATYRKIGTLSEGRFKSSLVNSDLYLPTYYRYIEPNPLRMREQVLDLARLPASGRIGEVLGELLADRSGLHRRGRGDRRVPFDVSEPLASRAHPRVKRAMGCY
jgi:hypothetical protein